MGKSFHIHWDLGSKINYLEQEPQQNYYLRIMSKYIASKKIARRIF